MKTACRVEPHSFVTAATEDTKIPFLSPSPPHPSQVRLLLYSETLFQVGAVSIFCWITATSSFGSLHFPGKFGQAQAWN